MPKPLPLAVLISGNGSNLQAIIDRIQQKTLHATIKGVISSQEGVAGLKRAQQAHIPCQVLLPKDYPIRQDYDQALQTAIQTLQVKLIVLAGFMRILGPAFVQHFYGRLINIHPALLPQHKGLNTHQAVIQAKDKSHGASVHFVNHDVDSGPIIAQTSCQVLPEDTPESLKAKVLSLEHRLYPDVIQWFAEDRIQLTKGQKVLIDQIDIGPQGKCLDYSSSRITV